MRTTKVCSSDLFGVLVDACRDKQDSLMFDGLRDKRTSTLNAINYSTVEIVDVTLPVIDSKARYWSKIVIFDPVRGVSVEELPQGLVWKN